jgi:nicotinate-nucleotide adenylyltransferase
MKIGIFGGTFNPIHYGHLRSAEEVRLISGLDRIFFVPSGNPPLKRKDLTDAGHRYNMVSIAARDNPFFEVLDIESTRPGKSFTVSTLQQLLKDYADADFSFISGVDAFLDIPNWREPEKILSLVNFIVISRPGKSFADLFHSPYLDLKRTSLTSLDRGGAAPVTAALQGGKRVTLAAVTPIGISSTDIRRRVKKGSSIKYLLPAEVESYIISNNLYREKN